MAEKARQTFASEAFRRYYDKLQVVISQPNLAFGLASQFYQKKIITRETRDAIQFTTNTTPNNQAALLLQAVEITIHVNPRCLLQFVRILRKETILKEVADALKCYYTTLVSDAGQTENSSSESETEYTKLKGFGEGPVSVVRTTIKQLQEKYCCLVTKTQKVVEIQCPNIAHFRTRITILPPAVSLEHQQKLKEIIPCIYNAKTIEEIFGFLNLLVWNYLNYGLLEHIIDVYGDDNIKQTMQEYASSVELFRKETPLRVFLSAQPGGKCPDIPTSLRNNLTKVMFKHGDLITESTLDEIEQYRQKLACEYSLPDFVMILVEIREGSVVTVWLMPQTVAAILKDRIPKSTKFLYEYHILLFKIEDITIYSGSVPQIAYVDLEFGDMLGRGGFSGVYKAHLKSRNMDVAVKRVLGRICTQEVRILSLLKHPCIIEFYGIVIDSPGPTEHYIVTELAEKGSLYNLLHKERYLPSREQSLQWTKEIAQGMNYMHQEEIMHKDLKSSNVLIAAGWNCKICDFGDAKEFIYTTQQISSGTLRWMAPELMKDEPVSLSCDVFSYGMLLYEIFAHQLPFTNVKSDVEVAGLIMNGEVPPIPDFIEDYLSTLIRWCWMTNPKERPNFQLILNTLQSTDPHDQKPTLKELQKHVVYHVAPKWKELGLQFNLDDDGSIVHSINETCGGDEEKCCLYILNSWLDGKVKEPKTWRTLMGYLREIGAEETIKSIEKNILKSTVSASQPMSPSHVPAAGLSHDQYPREFLQSHPHRWPKEPIESSLLTSTAFETIDYDIQLEPGKQIRNYQWELAEPGIKEENYIICAPTGTGKTLVAGLIISEHLQKRKQMIKPGKVVFMVTTKPLAQQQKGTLDEMIPQASVKSCIGDDGSTIEQLLKDEDIIVCTAGKLLNELKEDKVHLEEISLIVIDECHHTVKEAPQAKVMEIYLERKQQGKAMLPQVVGLTASPGAGDNPSLELEKTLHHLISLCALMDATSGIKTVTENVDELEKHKNKSTSRLESPNGREHGEEFISRITKEMADLEQLVSLRCPFPRWSQQYETSIQQKKQLLEMSLNPDHRNQINVLNLLRCYSRALNIYMDLRYEDAMAVLDEFMNFMSEEQATSLQKELKQRLECLKAELKELPRVPNPLLTQVKKKLCSQFAAEPMSKAICFVRTKKHASAFCDWISKLESRVEIRPNVFVGHTRETGPGMTQIEQEDVMKGFQEGKYNLLVATSVAEEGLDVPACNLVIRYQHISNEIAKVQTLGRARAANSQGFTILSSNSKKSFQEMRNEELDALVTEALLFLPVGQLLCDKVQKAQQEIIRDRAFKKQLVFLQYQSKFAYRDSVQLKCKVCKVNACKGGDIYVTESAYAYVVIDERFIENKIQIKLHHSHFKKLSEKVTKMSKMYCRNCNSDWGVMCIWPSEGYELPVLKCKSFIFEIDGVPRPVRKWSEAPFDIPPLSSHTGQLKLAEFFVSASQPSDPQATAQPSQEQHPRDTTEQADLLPLNQKPTIKELQNHVVRHVASKWEELGIQLNLDDDGSISDSISEKRGGDEAKCCLDVLKAWLQGKGEEPKTWRTLVDCLREIRTNECHEAIKSIEENVLQNILATSPSQLSPTAEPSQLQEIASPTLLPQVSEPAAINYKLKLEPGKQIRSYQWELAEPGINGENYIICAPTGTGKILVAGLIISEHLQKRKLDGKPGKVIFMVNTKPLAQQQMGELQKMIPGAFVKCCTGDDAGLITIQMLLKDEDMIVCTAGKLLNELNDAKVCFNEISLIVIDECHHTRKDTPYARVMRCYLEEKQIGKGELPQIVGLTASPGAGENPRLDLDKTLHHLTSLCALMDATSGIKTVVENIEELEKHTNKPVFRLQILPCRDRSEAFIAEITKQMTSLGNLVDLMCPFPQWSQQYETAIQQKKQPLEIDSSPEHRDAINTLKLLRCFSQTLSIYMDLRYEDAIAVLHQFTDLPTEEQATSREKELIRSLEYLKSELAKLPKEPNPLLIQVEEKLLSHFSKKPESKGICFVRTKKHAHAICDWISKLSSESGVEIHPKEFVGHTRETGPGMTQIDQEDVMKGFQEGKYNLLVATSVAEEGLDVPACNLVIRFQHVSNEIARKQTLGRARAAESEGYTILSNDSKKSHQEIKNKDLDALVTEALQYLPIGEPLRKIVTKQQEEIVQKPNLKKQLSKRRVSEGADRDSIKLKCKVCKTLACKGSDIYKAESNYVVADEDFRESKIRIEKFHSPKMYSENSKIARSGRIYCKGCDTEWGGMCVWPSAGYELPILKCKYFIFEIGDSPRPVRKWSEAPFDIPQLSSHPLYQGLDD